MEEREPGKERGGREEETEGVEGGSWEGGKEEGKEPEKWNFYIKIDFKIQACLFT